MWSIETGHSHKCSDCGQTYYDYEGGCECCVRCEACGEIITDKNSCRHTALCSDCCVCCDSFSFTTTWAVMFGIGEIEKINLNEMILVGRGEDTQILSEIKKAFFGDSEFEKIWIVKDSADYVGMMFESYKDAMRYKNDQI